MKSGTKNFIDISGARFGRLVVTSKTTKRSSSGTVIYSCLCDCGNLKEVDGVNLRRGCTQSCGCLAKEKLAESAKTNRVTHGATAGGKLPPTYKSWLTMRRRCNDPSYKDYPRYGGNGIKVCPEWENSYETFLKDMGKRLKGMTLDRIDNSKGYSKSNCRWATGLTQMNNTTRNRRILYQGKSLTIAQWARILGMPRARLSARINSLGWSIERAFKEGKNGHDLESEKSWLSPCCSILSAPLLE